MRLLTITLNPAIDMALSLPKMEWNGTFVASAARRAPGGKGINMARLASFYGYQASAMFPAGGASGRFLIEALEQEGLSIVPVSILEENRTNIVLHDAAKKSLKVNSPGPKLRSGEWAIILAEIKSQLETHDIIALGGSLPPGVSDVELAELLEVLRHPNKPLFIDIPHSHLPTTAQRARPFLVKPNAEELEASVGEKLSTRPERIKAAREILAAGAQYVAITDGPREALLASADGIWRSMPAAITARSMAGMGDAFGITLFLQLLEGFEPVEAFRRAMAAGAAIAASSETALLTTDQIDLCERAIEVNTVTP